MIVNTSQLNILWWMGLFRFWNSLALRVWEYVSFGNNQFVCLCFTFTNFRKRKQLFAWNGKINERERFNVRASEQASSSACLESISFHRFSFVYFVHFNNKIYSAHTYYLLSNAYATRFLVFGMKILLTYSYLSLVLHLCACPLYRRRLESVCVCAPVQCQFKLIPMVQKLRPRTHRHRSKITKIHTHAKHDGRANNINFDIFSNTTSYSRITQWSDAYGRELERKRVLLLKLICARI